MDARRGLAGVAGAIAFVAVLCPATALGETQVERFFYHAEETPPPGEEIYAAAGLTITALCDAHEVPGIDADLTLIARSEVEDASLHFARHQDPDAFTYLEEDDLDPGDEITLAHLTGGGQDFLGELVYSRPDGAVATVDLSGTAGVDYPGVSNCSAFGVARHTTATPDAEGPTRSVFFSGEPGDAATLLESPGLRLDASCTADDGLELSASVEEGGVLVGTSRTDQGRWGKRNVSNLGPWALDDAVGQMVFAGDGPTVSLDWFGENDDGHGGASPCLIAGTARVESPSGFGAIDFRAGNRAEAPLLEASYHAGLTAQCVHAEVYLVAGFGFSGSALYTAGTSAASQGGFLGVSRTPGGGAGYPDLVSEALATNDPAVGTGQLLIAGAGLDATPISIDYLAAEGLTAERKLGQPCVLAGTMDAIGDTKPPDTTIHNQRTRMRSRRPTFRFSVPADPGNDSAKTYFCRLDGKPATGTECESPYRSPRLKRGLHVFEAWAVDYFGNEDPTPAQYRFRVSANPAPAQAR